jgi:hypothetical protein
LTATGFSERIHARQLFFGVFKCSCRFEASLWWPNFEIIVASA